MNDARKAGMSSSGNLTTGTTAREDRRGLYAHVTERTMGARVEALEHTPAAGRERSRGPILIDWRPAGPHTH